MFGNMNKFFVVVNGYYVIVLGINGIDKLVYCIRSILYGYKCIVIYWCVCWCGYSIYLNRVFF